MVLRFSVCSTRGLRSAAPVDSVVGSTKREASLFYELPVFTAGGGPAEPYRFIGLSSNIRMPSIARGKATP